MEWAISEIGWRQKDSFKRRFRLLIMLLRSARFASDCLRARCRPPAAARVVSESCRLAGLGFFPRPITNEFRARVFYLEYRGTRAEFSLYTYDILILYSVTRGSTVATVIFLEIDGCFSTLHFCQPWPMTNSCRWILTIRSQCSRRQPC